MSEHPHPVILQDDDEALLQELLESSPFDQKILLRVALRIGLERIQKDPTILMPYLSKK